MAIRLQLQLLRGVEPKAALAALARAYADRGCVLARSASGTASRHELHERDGPWVALEMESAAWRWPLRRDALRAITKDLRCTGMGLFVHDGEYWGCELVREGEPRDRFVQDAGQAKVWFPEAGAAAGSPGELAAALEIDPRALEAYLVQRPRTEEHASTRAYLEELRRRNVPPRPGDEHPRFHPVAIADFLRLLGLRVAARDGRVRLEAPPWRTFWLTEPS